MRGELTVATDMFSVFINDHCTACYYKRDITKDYVLKTLPRCNIIYMTSEWHEIICSKLFAVHGFIFNFPLKITIILQCENL